MTAKLTGDVDERVAAWDACGAMALCGRPDGPALGPPAQLVPRLCAVGDMLACLAGRPVPDVLGLLTERAALLGLRRRCDVSCGGSTRLLAMSDGWLAVTLALPEDVACVPAWLELDGEPADPWSAVAELVALRSGADLVERAALLGLPAAALPDPLLRSSSRYPQRTARKQAGPAGGLPVRASAFGATKAPRRRFRVVELGALWAAPLCGRLLRLAGAEVVKVESRSRPDGSRQTPAFYERMNGGKEIVAADFGADLPSLIAGADVVIEASRPRALRQLGIIAEDLLARDGGPSVWVSITGYGRASNRVAFGDDAAVGGGLVVWDSEGPCFCADAIADPLSGIVAAAAALTALTSDRRWLVDVSMSEVAAHFAGPTLAA